MSNLSEFWQVSRFGVVGALATLTHITTFSIFMEYGVVEAIEANGIAYVVALVVTFVGNAVWVFRDSIFGRHQILRFASVSVAGLLINSVFVFVIVDFLAYPYFYAVLPMISVTPVLTYVGFRFWTFVS